MLAQTNCMYTVNSNRLMTKKKKLEIEIQL